MTDAMDKAFRDFTEAYATFRKENPPKPEKRTIKAWFNIYDRATAVNGLSITEDRRQADNYAAPDRIACIEREITYTVGEGLEP